MVNSRISQLAAALSSIIMLLISAATVHAETFDCSQSKHDYAIIENIPFTHTENGSITYKCRICGLEYKETLFANGHQWGEWKTEKPPTCTQAGIEKRTCMVGSTHSETRSVSATGHKYEESVTEPNCTEVGKKTITCTICGDNYVEEFGEAKGHHYNETITEEPACGREGLKTFTCVACGDNYTQVVPALSHTYGEWITKHPAREGIEGKRYKECSLCGEIINENIAALAIPEKKDKFGTTEAIVAGANFAALFVFSILLFGEFALLLWERRKKKEILTLQQSEEKGGDGYECI